MLIINDKGCIGFTDVRSTSRGTNDRFIMHIYVMKLSLQCSELWPSCFSNPVVYLLHTKSV